MAATAATIVAADPPGFVVVRPAGSSGTLVYPEKAGFVVIRPQRPGVVTPQPLAAPRGTSQTIVLIGKAPAENPPPPAAPVAKPKADGDDKTDGRVVLETWDVTSVKGQKIGYFHVVVREYEREGKKYLYATKSQKMTIARFGQVVEQWAQDATMETPDGQVLTTRMTQEVGRDQKLSLEGQVVGNKLRVTLSGAVDDVQEVPWPEGVLGIAREATLLKDRKPKAGDSFDYLYYEGRLNRVVKFTATVKGLEDAAPAEGAKTRPMLKVVLSMEPIGEFRLPPSTLWADPVTFEPVRMESDMPTLGGKLVVTRTTKEFALRPVSRVPDLFDVQSIRLDREIPNVHDQASVVYRVTLNSDLPVDKVFLQDARQTVKNADPVAKAFELHVTAVRRPKDENSAVDPGKEFLGSSFFIDWDNDAVRGYARQAVTGLPADATAWQKARAVELWVHKNMKSTEFSQAMATCSNVARTLSGDCTEYSMLAAGMCRALGVPSRTAVGLVYAPAQGGTPFLAYHMWFEVNIGGEWLALDATLGRGSVGPGHVKITDTSWHEERSFAPLLPVMTVLSATPKFEVMRVTAARR